MKQILKNIPMTIHLNKAVASFLFLILLLTGFNAHAQSQWKYLEIVTTDSVSDAVDLLHGTSIKFESGRMVASNGRENICVALDSLGKINHHKESYLNVHLNFAQPGYTPAYLSAELYDFTASELLDTTPFKLSGTATFTSVSPGWYYVKIYGESQGLENLVSEKFYHTIFSDNYLEINEKLISPINSEWRILAVEEGLFTVEFKWSNPEDFPLLFYKYKIYIDGTLVSELLEKKCRINGLVAGEHSVEIYGVSPSGNETEPLRFYITLDPSTTSVDFISEDSEWKYFDINGIERNSSNLRPGLYIRTDGKKTEEIIIKE